MKFKFERIEGINKMRIDRMPWGYLPEHIEIAWRTMNMIRFENDYADGAYRRILVMSIRYNRVWCTYPTRDSAQAGLPRKRMWIG